MKKLSVSINAMYESCDRITLYVSIHDADSPVYDKVPCYSGRVLRDALQQVFQLADFFEIERPNTDHLISENLYSEKELADALDDVNFMVDTLARNREFQKTKKAERDAKQLT